MLDYRGNDINSIINDRLPTAVSFVYTAMSGESTVYFQRLYLPMINYFFEFGSNNLSSIANF